MGRSMLSSDDRGEYDRPGGLESGDENGPSKMNPFRFGERGIIVRCEVGTSVRPVDQSNGAMREVSSGGSDGLGISMPYMRD